MRLYLFILLSCFLGFLSSCGPTSSDAAAYNDALIEEQNRVANKGEVFFAAMDKSPDEMKKAFASFSEQVDLSLKATRELGDFHGDTVFLHAASSALALQQGFCRNEYVKVVELLSKPDEEISEEDTELYSKLIGDIDALQKHSMEELNKAQSSFAKTWNFIIDPTLTFE